MEIEILHMFYNINVATTSVTDPVVSLSYIMSSSLVVVVFLLILLALKVIVSSDTYGNTKIVNLNTSLNAVIFPLLIVLIFLVAYMANTITLSL